MKEGAGSRQKGVFWLERRGGGKPFEKRATPILSPLFPPVALAVACFPFLSLPLPALVSGVSVSLSRKVTMEYPLMGDFPKKGIRLCWNPAVALSPGEKNPFCLKSGNQARCCVS